MRSDGLVTVREAAELVNRPRGTIASWRLKGLITVRGRRPGSGGAELFGPEEVKAVAARMDDSVRSNWARDYNRRQCRLEPELTAEEIEAIVEFQSRPENLPSWWHKSGQLHREGRED